MVTFRIAIVVLTTFLAASITGCSREQQDWRSAEAADTREAYGRFVELHPESELAVRAHERLAQLDEERDWTEAQRVATVEAYRQFLAHHASGKWSEEARIRIEAFSLGSAPRIGAAAPASAAATSPGPSGVRALQLATQATPPPVRGGGEPSGASQLIRAQPTVERAAARRSTVAPAGGGAYGVQLGAFGSEASADREWRRLQGQFGPQLRGLSPRIVQTDGAGGPLYRLQAPAAGEAQARALCDSLKQRSQPCVPVLPSH